MPGNAEILSNNTKVIFLPDVRKPWPPGLEIEESLFSLQRGRSFKLKVAVHNSTAHPITLSRRTPLGRVELIKSVTPFDIRPKLEPRYHNESTGQSRSDVNTKIHVNQVSTNSQEGISDFLTNLILVHYVWIKNNKLKLCLSKKLMLLLKMTEISDVPKDYKCLLILWTKHPFRKRTPPFQNPFTLKSNSTLGTY